MDCSTTLPAATAAATRLPRLSSTAAFALQASIIVTFLAGASAPTPLYAAYQAQWGFSSLGVTLVFGVYALAVLVALLFLGRLSDHIGRRPVLFAAIAGQLLAMGLFANADGLAALMVARIVQGFSAGAALSAIGAGLLDLDKARGAVANSIMPPVGTALGGIAAGLMVSFLPAPEQLVYLAFAVLFVLQGVGVFFMPETLAAAARSSLSAALASLRPQFAFSAATRAPLLRAAPPIVAAWAVAGFFASLGPALVRNVIGANSPLLSGMALFVMAGSAAIAVLLLKGHEPRRVLSIAASGLIVGTLVFLAALSLHSPVVFFTGLVIAGVGFGTAFQGAVRSVVAVASAEERAGVLSVIFLLAYLAMGLPAIAAGLLLSQGGEIVTTAREFGALVIVLALLSLPAGATVARFARRQNRLRYFN